MKLKKPVIYKRGKLINIFYCFLFTNCITILKKAVGYRWEKTIECAAVFLFWVFAINFLVFLGMFLVGWDRFDDIDMLFYLILSSIFVTFFYFLGKEEERSRLGYRDFLKIGKPEMWYPQKIAYRLTHIPKSPLSGWVEGLGFSALCVRCEILKYDSNTNTFVEFIGRPEYRIAFIFFERDKLREFAFRLNNVNHPVCLRDCSDTGIQILEGESISYKSPI